MTQFLSVPAGAGTAAAAAAAKAAAKAAAYGKPLIIADGAGLLTSRGPVKESMQSWQKRRRAKGHCLQQTLATKLGHIKS